MTALRLAFILTGIQALLVLLGARLEDASLTVAFFAFLAPLYSRRVHRFYRQAFLLAASDAG